MPRNGVVNRPPIDPMKTIRPRARRISAMNVWVTAIWPMRFTSIGAEWRRSAGTRAGRRRQCPHCSPRRRAPTLRGGSNGRQRRPDARVVGNVEEHRHEPLGGARFQPRPIVGAAHTREDPMPTRVEPARTRLADPSGRAGDEELHGEIMGWMEETEHAEKSKHGGAEARRRTESNCRIPCSRRA